jgi:hypothetical protein
MMFDDETGTLLQDDAAAEAHARRVIRELKADADFDAAPWRITVRNEAGGEVATIAFKDIA